MPHPSNIRSCQSLSSPPAPSPPPPPRASSTTSPSSGTSIWTGMNHTKIGLPGKSILRDYFNENRTSQRPFLSLRISFPPNTYFYTIASSLPIVGPLLGGGDGASSSNSNSNGGAAGALSLDNIPIVGDLLSGSSNGNRYGSRWIKAGSLSNSSQIFWFESLLNLTWFYSSAS